MIMGRMRNNKTPSTTTAKRRPLVITKICVRDLSKPRSFHLDDEVTSLTTKIENIINDPEIDMVVEVTGDGNNYQTRSSKENDLLAKVIVTQSLANQKMVVTANNALIAEHLDLIQSMCGSFGFEAAVCGGIPIIHILQQSCTADVIHQLHAICNDTMTNYILGKMEHEEMEYDTALQHAEDFFNVSYQQQELEEDENNYGNDYSLVVRNKLCILSKLAFGITVPPRSVPCKGISQLSPVDFEYAKLLNCNIQLIGTAQRLHEAREWDGPLCVFVSPVMVPTDHVLSSSCQHKNNFRNNNRNVIAVTSANMGTCSYLGPGFGRFPAANSIVTDICHLAEQTRPSNPFPIQEPQLDLDYDYTSVFYIRIPFQDGLGIIKRVGELAEQAGVSIHSILQTPITDRMSADFVVTTEDAKVSQVEELCDSINQQEDFCRAPCMFMPLLVALDEYNR